MSAPVEKYHHPIARRTDWETPPSVFLPLHAEFGFSLDVCATAANTKVYRYFTPEIDGLSQDWGAHICWMNPPYGRAIREWMRKAHLAATLGATVVCLVPARTDSAWWHDYAERGERRFIRGRIKFIGAEHNAPFPSAFIVFRAEAA